MMVPSKNRSLDKTEVEKILAQDKVKRADHQHSFLSANIVDIAEAVKKGQSFVIIENRRFSIKRTPYYDGSVHLNPDVGFVPCGYFSLSRLDNALKGAE